MLVSAVQQSESVIGSYIPSFLHFLPFRSPQSTEESSGSPSLRPLNPARPGPNLLVPGAPITPGGGGVPDSSRSQPASPPDLSTPGLGGARSVSKVARVQERLAPGGAGVRGSGRRGWVGPGGRRRAHSPSLPCAAAVAASRQPHRRARQARGARRSMPRSSLSARFSVPGSRTPARRPRCPSPSCRLRVTSAPSA